MDNEENSSEPADHLDAGIILHSSNHKKCVICGLKSVKSSGVSFHRFPKNSEMSDKWAHKTGLKFVINATPVKRFWNFRVCSHHFNENDYANNSQKRLKPIAVPSVTKNNTNVDISLLRKTLAENLTDKNEMEDTKGDIIRNTSVSRTGVPVCTSILKRKKLEHIVKSIKIKIEEGSPMGGGECSESPAHIMEPQVELDEELDHPPLEPNVELVEPHVELEEGTDQSANVYPLDTLSVEFYEGTDDAQQGESTIQNFHENETTINGLSHDSEDTSVDAAIHDNSQCNSVDDTSLDADEITMDNSDAMDSSFKEDNDNTNYNEMQRTYLEGFFSSSASASVDESSNPSFERIPLSRFPSIVKVVERAEYETIQILYQLLYQRSAWDTQEILSKRILEFSGFNFNKASEEYYNREVMLQTLPNSVLVKIGAILCLDQVKNVLSNVGLGRHDLINAIMEFLALPRKKTRAPRLINDTKSVSKEPVEPCGCRSNCLSKFTAVEREFIATYHTTLKEKRKNDSYFLNLIQVNKSSKKPGEDSKKHRDYKYSYKIKLGRKEVQVCKGGFMMLHNVKMSKLNHIQTRLKKGNFPKALLMAAEYPAPEGTVEPEEILPKPDEKSDVSNECSVENSASNSVEDSSESSSSKLEDVSVRNEENVKVEEEIKKSITKKVPAVLVEKIDPSKISAKKENVTDNDSSSNKDKENSRDSLPTTDENVKKKLKDFPLVVKCLDEVSEELLIDLHFLLFLTSAENNKLKENILEFGGFSFDTDCEEYDERNEFLQRMSGKLITDVARSFSLGVLSKREETIENILSFLMKPDESFLRTNASVPVILSDVELDDIEGFSDSDESITCEVVEKKVECIDLLSSGEDSDKEDKKPVPIKKEKVDPTPVTNVTSTVATTATNSVADKVTTAPSTEVAASSESGSSGGIRRLKDFETIRKIVNTHPPEYLVDIYELLFLKKHEPATLRNEILDFSGFTFEKGSPDYVKRRLVLDRMLYNNVRRVYNTLIHNSTEVKVFSKPTMINEIFQFLFKLPDHDTSVRPLPPGAKTLMPKTPVPAAKTKSTPIPNTPPTTAPASILPSQTGKLSDLKRVFQRVACFPCEYLVDVHKLLFMSDCDPKVIRQNIFGFKGFSFAVDSPEFQQRKMYLEYLTFHSLRKISSVLTTRSVDLRNSTKHELASHLTDVLAEYCNTLIDTASLDTSTSDASGNTKTTTTSTASNSVSTSESSSVENIVITPIIEGFKSAAPSNSKKSNTKSSASNSLNISIVETRSISSPTVSTTANSSASSKGSSPAKGNSSKGSSSAKGSSTARGSRKRKSQTTYKRQGPPEKKTPPPPPPPAPTDFADIHLPEVEQYRQIYGANLNVYPSVPTITGIASFGSPVPQTFPQLVPQAMTFPLVSPYPQTLQMSGMQQSAPMLGLQSTGITMSTPIITQVSTKLTETIVPADIEMSEDPKSQIIPSNEKADIPKSPSREGSGKDSSPSKDSEEDGDKPLASLIGHPMDSVLKKHICDIVEKTDLQDITMNGVIKRIYDMYPKFDLSYRKEFIKSTLRSILYKLGENSGKKESARDSNSPDCSVTTSDINDCSLPGSPVTNT